MTQRAFTLRFVVPEMLAVASGIVILIGIVYFMHKYPDRTIQEDANNSVAGSRGSVGLPNPDVRLTRVRLLLSKWN